MRDPARIDRILELIKEIWKANPDLRLGQIIANASPIRGDQFYVRDEYLEDGLKQLKDKVTPS